MVFSSLKRLGRETRRHSFRQTRLAIADPDRGYPTGHLVDIHQIAWANVASTGSHVAYAGVYIFACAAMPLACTLAGNIALNGRALCRKVHRALLFFINGPDILRNIWPLKIHGTGSIPACRTQP